MKQTTMCLIRWKIFYIIKYVKKVKEVQFALQMSSTLLQMW